MWNDKVLKESEKVNIFCKVAGPKGLPPKINFFDKCILELWQFFHWLVHKVSFKYSSSYLRWLFLKYVYLFQWLNWFLRISQNHTFTILIDHYISLLVPTSKQLWYNMNCQSRRKCGKQFTKNNFCHTFFDEVGQFRIFRNFVILGNNGLRLDNLQIIAITPPTTSLLKFNNRSTRTTC